MEDFAAELKRLYDRAYERKDPEIRQQSLVDKFLAGLQDQDLQFAVEWSKEPSTIEEAIRHVIHYMEARQGRTYEKNSEYSSGSCRYSPNHRRVTFSDDSDSDDHSDSPTRRPASRSPIRRSRPSVRQVVSSNGKSNGDTKPPGADAGRTLVQAMEQFVASFGAWEVSSHCD